MSSKHRIDPEHARLPGDGSRRHAAAVADAALCRQNPGIPGANPFHRRHFPGCIFPICAARGIDFEEFRPYQAGDDIRLIDWRVTARTGRPFIKVFREERERPVIIAVDQTHNMYFGSRVAFKSVIAAQAAAVFCWLAIDNGDRVGGLVFSDRGVEAGAAQAQPALGPASAQSGL